MMNEDKTSSQSAPQRDEPQKKSYDLKHKIGIKNQKVDESDGSFMEKFLLTNLDYKDSYVRYSLYSSVREKTCVFGIDLIS